MQPRRHTFILKDRPAFYSFSRRQKIPPHKIMKGPRAGQQHPNRKRCKERWTLSCCFLALDAAGKIDFPIKLKHALGNQSPDFIVAVGLSPAEGYEVTQATTTKYQEKLARLEKPGGPKWLPVGSEGGWSGHQAEFYWCRRILYAVGGKLRKLAKGHYQKAAAQHLLIYDDMETAAVDLAEALQRLQPRLSQLLTSAKVKFDTISVISTQSRLLFDIGGTCGVLPIPPPPLEPR